MLGFDPRSLPEKLLSAAVNLLLAAIALALAIHFLAGIWRQLAFIGGSVIAAAATTAAIRWWLHRRRSW